MQFRALLKGLIGGLSLPVLASLVIAAWFYLPGYGTLKAAPFLLIVAALMPLVAGGITGFAAGQRGIYHGGVVSAILWLLFVLLVIWLAPQILGAWLWLAGVIALFLGSIGGLCGVNLKYQKNLREQKSEES